MDAPTNNRLLASREDLDPVGQVTTGRTAHHVLGTVGHLHHPATEFTATKNESDTEAKNEKRKGGRIGYR